MSEQHRGRPLNNGAVDSLSKLSETHDYLRETLPLRLASHDKLPRGADFALDLVRNGTEVLNAGAILLRAVFGSEDEPETKPVVIAPEYDWSKAVRGPVTTEPARVPGHWECRILGLDVDRYSKPAAAIVSGEEVDDEEAISAIVDKARGYLELVTIGRRWDRVTAREALLAVRVVHTEMRNAQQLTEIQRLNGLLQGVPARRDDDFHLEDPQYALHGALTSCAETLERLTEVSLVLEPDGPKVVRRRLQEAVGRCSESFRLTVAAWDASVQSKDKTQPGMRSEYDFAAALRSPVGRSHAPKVDPTAPTMDLNADDPNENGGT